MEKNINAVAIVPKMAIIIFLRPSILLSSILKLNANKTKRYKYNSIAPKTGAHLCMSFSKRGLSPDGINAELPKYINMNTIKDIDTKRIVAYLFASLYDN
jgi:hypothetical protein